MLPTLLPCYAVEYLCWQLLDQPFFFYIFSSFRPSLPRFPHGVYKSCAVSCASSPLFRPPRSYPRSCSRYPRPRSHLRYCPRFRPRSHPMFVYESTPLSPCPLPPRARSRPRSHPALLRSPSPPFPLRSVPVPMTVHVPVLPPAPDSNPTHGSVRSFPSPGPDYPLGTMRACVCMRVCEFIELHITAQSGPVILVILCTRIDPPKGGSMILNNETSDQTRPREHTLSSCTILT